MITPIKRKLGLQVSLILLSITCVVTLQSCSNDCPSVGDEEVFMRYGDLATASHAASDESSEKEKVHVYLDYSNGMHAAVNQSYDFFTDVINILDRNEASFYRVGFGSPQKMEDNILDPRNEFNPRNPENFKDPRSHLLPPLKQIVRKTEEQSIFITDFERVPDNNKKPRVQYFNGQRIKTNIDFSPWASKEFEKWLKEGGAIDIFAKKFNEYNNNEERYIYFIVFTPAKMIGEEVLSSIFYRMEQEGYCDGKDGIEWLGFSRGRFSGKRDYKPRENGGINSNLAPSLSLFGKKWDFYQLNYSDISFLQDLSKEEGDPFIYGDLNLIGKKSNFSDPEVSLKVYTMKEDFVNFQDNYYMDNAYSEAGNVGKQVKDLFILYADDDKEVLGFELEPDYFGMETSCELYKIEFWLEEAELEMDEDRMDEILQWQDQRTGGVLTVSSLSKSMQEAMKRQSLKPQLLHTIYLELLNN